MAETEAQLRARLGIPPDAKRVLILSQSSHMDWDWNRTFPDYYDVSVDNILEVATHVLAKYSTNLQPYYYSVAETGFLQRFWQKHPNALQSLRNSGHTLHMVGGGITSPDSLLNHGEVFIRNFLVGQRALRNVSLPAMTNIWVPDDLYVKFALFWILLFVAASSLTVFYNSDSYCHQISSISLILFLHFEP